MLNIAYNGLDMPYKRYIPSINRLYFRCANCGKEWEWPINKLRKYCSRKCSNAVYYRSKFLL